MVSLSSFWNIQLIDIHKRLHRTITQWILFIVHSRILIEWLRGTFKMHTCTMNLFLSWQINISDHRKEIETERFDGADDQILIWCIESVETSRDGLFAANIHCVHVWQNAYSAPFSCFSSLPLKSYSCLTMARVGTTSIKKNSVKMVSILYNAVSMIPFTTRAE